MKAAPMIFAFLLWILDALALQNSSLRIGVNERNVCSGREQRNDVSARPPRISPVSDEDAGDLIADRLGE